MEERTKAIIQMIKDSEGDCKRKLYDNISDVNLAEVISRGGYKEFQNIYDAGWRRVNSASEQVDSYLNFENNGAIVNSVPRIKLGNIFEALSEELTED